MTKFDKKKINFKIYEKLRKWTNSLFNKINIVNRQENIKRYSIAYIWNVKLFA